MSTCTPTSSTHINDALAAERHHALETEDALAAELRHALESEDAVAMVYAETYHTRRDNLPHRRDTACLPGRNEEGCDGLCALAVASTIDDVVAYYRRALSTGRAGRLDNPGGYARTLIRRRHRDVVCALTRPEGGYARPERLGRARNRPGYLGLDDTDGQILACAIAYLRSGNTPTTLDEVGASAEDACRRHNLPIEHGRGPDRLRRIIDHLETAGGRTATFIRREVLDLLAARQVALPGDTTLARHIDATHPIDTDELADAMSLYRIIEQIQQHLAAHGGWANAPEAARIEALREATYPNPILDLEEALALLDDLLS